MEENAETKKSQKIRWLLVIEICIIFFVILFIISQFFVPYHDRDSANRFLCMSRLKNLGLVLINYAQDHNNMYPDANKWCDILIQDKDFHQDMLWCPSDGVGPFNYAMNPNCTNAMKSSDLVLLFETKYGWNQHGGPEILNPENHPWRGTKGCTILFNDGHVEFVEPKDFNSLKWK
jgi:prepilin-type processing-associated H-X9-DG protein